MKDDMQRTADAMALLGGGLILGLVAHSDAMPLWFDNACWVLGYAALAVAVAAVVVRRRL